MNMNNKNKFAKVKNAKGKMALGIAPKPAKFVPVTVPPKLVFQPMPVMFVQPILLTQGKKVAPTFAKNKMFVIKGPKIKGA